MTRSLVVDDSHFMRTVISDLLEGSGIEAVAERILADLPNVADFRVLSAGEITDGILATVRNT